jgi:hypothetical protein
MSNRKQQRTRRSALTSKAQSAILWIERPSVGPFTDDEIYLNAYVFTCRHMRPYLSIIPNKSPFYSVLEFEKQQHMLLKLSIVQIHGAIWHPQSLARQYFHTKTGATRPQALELPIR